MLLRGATTKMWVPFCINQAIERLRMFRVLSSLVVTGIFTSNFLCAQIITYSFTGAAGNEATFAVDSQPDDGTASDMGRGAGVNASSAAGTFSANSWSTGGLDVDDYFAFSLTPDPGFRFSLTELQLDERRSATGIRDWSIRSSLDAFAVDIGTAFSVPDNTSTRSDQSIDLTGGLFDDLTSAIEFRVFGYNAETSSGTWRLDNVELFGAVTPVPEISGTVWVALGLAGLFCWKVKKALNKISSVS
jgi:hypothetical protein